MRLTITTKYSRIIRSSSIMRTKSNYSACLSLAYKRALWIWWLVDGNATYTAMKMLPTLSWWTSIPNTWFAIIRKTKSSYRISSIPSLNASPAPQIEVIDIGVVII